MLVVLARRGILTRAEARGALERLRPAIRLAAYWEARQDLESEGRAVRKSKVVTLRIHESLDDLPAWSY